MKRANELDRRRFLKVAACLAGGAFARPANLFATEKSQAQNPRTDTPDAAKLTRAEVERRIRPLFRCDDPDMWRLTVDAYQQCILGGLRPAEPPLNHTWLAPGGQFVGQWLWDTMFVVELLGILPDQRETVRGVFQNYWDFQDRWNAAMPEYAHGMVANFIAPYSVGGNHPGTAWTEYPAYSQAPLLARGMERVYRRNADVELLRAGIAHLEAFHEWYWRERDLHDVGLVCVGAYSDDVQHSLELARSDGAQRDEEWQTCCRRSAGMYDPAGVLGPGRYVRSDTQTLRASRELLLRF